LGVTNIIIYSLGHYSSGMWLSCHWVIGAQDFVGLRFPVINSSWTFLFRHTDLLEIRPLGCLKMSGTNYPLVQPNIPEEGRHQPQCCKSLIKHL